MGIALNNGIELEHTKTKLLCGLQAVQHQFFTDMLSPACGGYSIASIADMSTATDIIGVQDIQSDNLSIILRYAGMALGSKEVSTGFFRQAFFLGKGNAIFHHFMLSLLIHIRNGWS
jgi:hypothetical protein